MLEALSHTVRTESGFVLKVRPEPFLSSFTKAAKRRSICELRVLPDETCFAASPRS